MTGECPGDFLDETMIALKEREQARKCADSRTVSLISHTAKIVARVLRRLEQMMEEVLGEDRVNW